MRAVFADPVLVSHQPDDDDADHGRDEADDAQLAVRHVERSHDGALGAERKGGEQNALDREQ